MKIMGQKLAVLAPSPYVSAQNLMVFLLLQVPNQSSEATTFVSFV